MTHRLLPPPIGLLALAALACAGCVGGVDSSLGRIDVTRAAEQRALAALAPTSQVDPAARRAAPLVAVGLPSNAHSPAARQQVAYAPPDASSPAPVAPWTIRAQSPDSYDYRSGPLPASGYPVQPAQYNQPAPNPNGGYVAAPSGNFGPPPIDSTGGPPSAQLGPPQDAPIYGQPAPFLGGGGVGYPGPNPYPQPPGGPGSYTGMEPPLPGTATDLEIMLREAQTGRFMIGVGVNSNAGVVGNIVIDERNFDWTRMPNTFDEVINGTAFRGAGQGFRIEAMPGSQVQRYMVSFTEPYWLDTPLSLRLSAFYFTRNYFDWNEQRLGGRIELGYRLTPDTSVALAVRAENVDIFDPRVLGVPELDAALGKSDLFGARVSITHDTRDNAFSPTDGYYLNLAYEQVFGAFDFPQAEIDFRKYYLVSERPDGSGRHTLGFTNRVGFSGSQTPIYENFFAGGFSTLRGFQFRGASPIDMGVRVGGEFQFLGSVEYLFPVTADDMMKGVVFCDYGTVEEKIEIQSDNFRVAVGAGLRITVPAMGPAPIALDFAFPLASAAGDDEQMFSFFVGLNR